MTDINSIQNRFLERAQEGLIELTETLSKKVTILNELKAGRLAPEQERLDAKIRGVEAGLRITRRAESAFDAYSTMNQELHSTPEAERPGLEIAIQDARIISQL